MYHTFTMKTHLPTFILSYGRALLSAPWRFNLVYVACFAGKSHDFLTRGLKCKYPFKQLLGLLLSDKVLSEGYIIIDETDIDKSFAEKIAGLGWIYSHRKNKYIFGYHLVVACWTNEVITIPLAWKIYRKGSGKTKTDLALELIQYCLGTLRVSPKAFLFDAFYASEAVLKYLTQHNQTFYSQLPKSRLLNHQVLSFHEKGRPYWLKVGKIRGNILVQVVKNRRKYFVTNAVGITRQEQLGTYKLRWKIEDLFRFTKQELGLERCQVVSLQGQQNHFGTCFLLYGVLQDMAAQTQMTVYQLKLKATQDASFAKCIDLEGYFSTA